MGRASFVCWAVQWLVPGERLLFARPCNGSCGESVFCLLGRAMARAGRASFVCSAVQWLVRGERIFFAGPCNGSCRESVFCLLGRAMARAVARLFLTTELVEVTHKKSVPTSQ